MESKLLRLCFHFVLKCTLANFTFRFATHTLAHIHRHTNVRAYTHTCIPTHTRCSQDDANKYCVSPNSSKIVDPYQKIVSHTAQLAIDYIGMCTVVMALCVCVCVCVRTVIK